jgi:hypothetical protein
MDSGMGRWTLEKLKFRLFGFGDEEAVVEEAGVGDG